MTRIVAIGGGEIRKRETLPFDRYIVSVTKRQRPKALFVPTASRDSRGYCDVFREIYGEELGCEVDVLRLIDEPSGRAELHAKIEAADLIYVGGGNTRLMLDVWRREGVDRLLRDAGRRGAVLCGLSAGAICWFRYGNSDAPVIEGFAQAGAPKTVPVEGLGLVEASLCPHMTTEPFRWNEVRAMMREIPGVCIALDDLCALEVVDDSYRILGLRDDHCAYRITSKAVTEQPIVRLEQDVASEPVRNGGFRSLRRLTDAMELEGS